ncbi:MAG: hypothetical protein ACRDTT_14065 [Pseudonocardiaceae bacterium]
MGDADRPPTVAEIVNILDDPVATSEPTSLRWPGTGATSARRSPCGSCRLERIAAAATAGNMSRAVWASSTASTSEVPTKKLHLRAANLIAFVELADETDDKT